MKTQNQRIAAHLKTGKSLNPLQALNKFGCFRLGARIFDLREQGVDVKSKTVTKNGKRFASYYLALLLLLFVGCETRVDSVQDTGYKLSGLPLTIYVIDDCEYFVYCVGCRGGMMTHKGNCKNPIHKCN